MIRRTMASLALQAATATLAVALPHAEPSDAFAARSAAMSAIGRNVGAVKGRGDWTIQPIGLARAAMAAGMSVLVSGAAAYGTLALAVAMVTP